MPIGVVIYEFVSMNDVGSYLAEEIVVERHLTLRIDVLQIPAEAFALQSMAQRATFADITGGRFAGS